MRHCVLNRCCAGASATVVSLWPIAQRQGNGLNGATLGIVLWTGHAEGRRVVGLVGFSEGTSNPGALFQCAMGNTSTLCAWSPLCRDGIAPVIKFTKSRKMLRHFYSVYCI